MTDEQIIKAYEICYINKEDGCESCPLRDEEGFCTDVGESTLLYDVLDLINRQKAEIERLKGEVANISAKTLKRFEKNIKDVKVTLGQTWEIQNAIKKTLKEMVGED